jgi:dTMP kinase
MLITFEGLDYSGKSTQVQLLSDRLATQDCRVLVLREPGGTEIGEKIRKMLLDKANSGMTEASEMLLFSASRSQLVHEVVRPALEAGMIVICDRYYDSTTAYQGYGRGIALDVIQVINKYAADGLSPDLTFFLDIPIREIDKRMTAAKKNKDRMESSGIEFYTRVRDGYLQIAKNESRYRIVDGMQHIDELHEFVWQTVSEIIKKNDNGVKSQ